MSSVPEVGEAPPATRRSLLPFLPLAGFVLIAALFLVRLHAGDPSIVPSALIGRPVPSFALAPVDGLDRPGLTDADLRSGHVTLLNVFASWCAECHDEHAALMQLAADPKLQALGVRLDGIAYKDKPEDSRRYLGAKGNPFQAVGSDASGRAGIDFGVYGVPETFVVKGDGTIAYKLIGGVSATTLGPLMAAIAQAAR
jgi:cytochrome c biogenesis protein CcmG, thiol:disulfide interchange protein DsbE